jgi:PUA domain protein
MTIKRHFLKADVARNIRDILNSYDIESTLDGKIEVFETMEFSLILLDGTPIALCINETPFFTVRGAMELKPRKHIVTVDMGAVKFIRNGADVMSPGIVGADESIRPGDLVVVIEERYKKPLGVGTALISGTEMVHSAKGKAVKIAHHVGDAIWNLSP